MIDPALGLDPALPFAGRYVIESTLGRGGMGVVYRAKDLALGGDTIALKVLTIDTEAAAMATQRFRQEVRLARLVTHPNVARVYDLGEAHEPGARDGAGGSLYMTMELVPGPTLREEMRRIGRFDAAHATAVLAEIADGLAAAHQAGVVHRDLKPSNVLLDSAHGGRAVITDFGIARSLDEVTTQLTSGAIGTPSYMSPEQAAGAHIDARTDLFSLGLVAFELLVGELPREIVSMFAAAAGPRPLLAAHAIEAALIERNAPRALVALITRCLAIEPGMRPSSAADVRRELVEIHDGLGGRRSSPAPARVDVDAPTSAAPLADATGSTPSAIDTTRRLAERALAVLPFRYRGPQEHDYLGEALTDELVDQLSRVRGLRVFASAATARFREDRDPRRVARELGAQAVIDGSVLRHGDHLRIDARLLDATGLQLWSDRVDAPFADACIAVESIARRVSEELRVQVVALAHGTGAPPAALEAYFHARERLHSFEAKAALEAHDALGRCIDAAPDFAPAYAAHAAACLRCWFLRPDGRDWSREVEVSVARAEARAPDLAETHLVAGLYGLHIGEFAHAFKQMRRALLLAPMYAEAHEQLGGAECEAGAGAEGGERLRLALQLDPTLTLSGLVLAREAELGGDSARCDALLLEAQRRTPATTAVWVYTVRIYGWRRDWASVRALAEPDVTRDAMHFVLLHARGLLGDLEVEAYRALAESHLAQDRSGRFRAVALQMGTEVFTVRGAIELAFECIRRLLDTAFLDRGWLERCPLLDPLRADPRFIEARRVMRLRCAVLLSA